ncbi:MAG: xanthine dehydrogenase family protein molybdopterin-binding subunit [Rhizobiaceae bacterium]
MGVGKIVRRTFLIGAAAIAGGAAFGYYVARKPYPNPLERDLASGESTFNPWIKIAQDNSITVITPRAEMGQGVHTTLAALVAEELEVPFDAIRVEHGPADWAYYNSVVMEDGGPFPTFDEGFLAESMRSMTHPITKILGLQVTGGSTSIRDGYVKMREAGCAARQMLVAAAAARFGAAPGTLTLENGTISDQVTGQSATYGELAADAVRMPVPTDLKLKDKADWKILGKPAARVDLEAKVNGTAVFGIDVDLPDMVYATVRMSPRFGAGAVSFSADKTMAVPGVIKVVPVETSQGRGFGVIASSTWAAFKGAEALDVVWEEASYPADSQAMFSELAERLRTEPDFTLRNDGNAETAFADAPREELLEAEYQVPWLAHACMEPMNATARWKDGKLEIWSPNQAPTLLQMTTAPLVGVDAADVIVHTTYMGGGFGRRAEADFTAYAVQIAMETQGKPVKVTWTREEDTRHDTYRPAAMSRMRARIVKGDVPSGVDIRIASPSIVRSFVGRTFPSVPLMGPDKTLTEGAHDQPYDFASYRVSGHVSSISVPVGFWRSVGNSFNAFFHECFMDEIAEASGLDPLALRLKAMASHPTAIAVLEKVASMSGWGYPLAKGRGMGIAHTLSFGSWVAQVVQVKETTEGIRIEKVWCAADVGTALDPSIVRAQMMSGIIFGLSSAIGQEITFADGEVEQSNFTDYDALRMNQCPSIEVEILENWHRIGGVGEPGTPPAIPALANAVYQATGKRVRSLPMNSQVDFA